MKLVLSMKYCTARFELSTLPSLLKRTGVPGWMDMPGRNLKRRAGILGPATRRPDSEEFWYSCRSRTIRETISSVMMFVSSPSSLRVRRELRAQERDAEELARARRVQRLGDLLARRDGDHADAPVGVVLQVLADR